MDGLEPIGRALVIIGVFITVLGAVVIGEKTESYGQTIPYPR